MYNNGHSLYVSLHDISTFLLRCPKEVLTAVLSPEELTLFNDANLEAPPTPEELNLLREGYEQRILSGIALRINTTYALKETA